MDPGAVARLYSSMLEADGVAALGRVLADDFVAVWPQSGERVVGRENLARILTAHPERPTLPRPPRVTRLDDAAWVVEAHQRYAGTPYWDIARLELHDDGTVHRIVSWFAARFEPAPHRAAFVETFDPLDPPDEPLPAPASTDGVTRERVEAYAAAVVAFDAEALRRLAHPGWQAAYPQSGERLPSLEAALAAQAAYPGGPPTERSREIAGAADHWAMSPMLTPVRMSGSGAEWFGEADIEHPDGSRWWYLNLVRYRDGRVWRDRRYHCAAFEAPPWRAAWVERAGPEPALG